VEAVRARLWRAFPREPMTSFKDLRKGLELRRNRDSLWLKQLDKKSSDRRVGVWLNLADEPGQDANAQQRRLVLSATDETGVFAEKHLVVGTIIASDAIKNEATIKEHLGKLGSTIYALQDGDASIGINLSRSWFIAPSALNAARRELVEALDAARVQALQPLERKAAVQPPVAFPQDSLTYLGNVLNHQAHAFYTRHGVRVIEPAYEAYTDMGEVSLMITKHCVRWSMSLCPKQAKGVVGVKGTVKAEPLQLVNGKEKLTLRFDCKPCEMHVVGKMKPGQVQAFKNELKSASAQGVPMKFYKTRPKAVEPVMMDS
jgi:23S rRNA 5-hydroxycytidine C2501 synthase